LSIDNDLQAAQRRQPRNTSGLTMPEPEEMGHLREQLARAQNASARAQVLFNQVSNVLFDDLYDKLATRKLIAKGQQMLDGMAQPERIHSALPVEGRSAKNRF